MSFIFEAINWKLKIMKKWLCKICFLWENKNRTVVNFLLIVLFVSLSFVYILLVRNKRLNKENRLLQRQYEAVDNALFRMEEMQKTYLQYENMKEIDDIDLKTETDSILKLSSLLGDKKKIVVRISNAACVSCIQDFCAVLFQYFSGSEIIYISDYGSAKELFFMKQVLGIENQIYRVEALKLPIDKEKKFYVFIIDKNLSIEKFFLPHYEQKELMIYYLDLLKKTL